MSSDEAQNNDYISGAEYRHPTSEGAENKPAIQSPNTGYKSNHDKAIDYLEYVRIRHITQPDVYDSFLKIMKELYLGKLSTADATAKVSMLFNEDAELMKGFGTFLQ